MPVDLLGSIAGNVLTLRCQHSALGRLIICQRIGLIQQRIRIFFRNGKQMLLEKPRIFGFADPEWALYAPAGGFSLPPLYWSSHLAL